MLDESDAELEPDEEELDEDDADREAVEEEPPEEELAALRPELLGSMSIDPLNRQPSARVTRGAVMLPTTWPD